MSEASRHDADEALLDRLFGTVEELHTKSGTRSNASIAAARFEPDTNYGPHVHAEQIAIEGIEQQVSNNPAEEYDS